MIVSYMATEKIAITVDEGLLAEVERLRHRTGESRSAVFNRAVRQLIRLREHEERVSRYVEAYRKYPETAEEIDAAEQLATESLRHVGAWDEG
jgi:metal-responsive CopG/Arc/MetJ family transcriptional regulator